MDRVAGADLAARTYDARDPGLAEEVAVLVPAEHLLEQVDAGRRDGLAQLAGST